MYYLYCRVCSSAVLRQSILQCSVEVLRKLYISLIRPGLEYCCIVWDPSVKGLVKDLENVQKLATKICLKRWHMSYEEMVHAMQIPTLQFQRSYMKLVFLFKIVNDMAYFPSGNNICISKLQHQHTELQSSPSSNMSMQNKLFYVLVCHSFYFFMEFTSSRCYWFSIIKFI